MFTIPQEAAENYPEHLQTTTKTRNVYTGIFEQALAKTARHIGTPIPSARQVRLDITEAIFGVKISSFKELSDAEIWALFHWVTDTNTKPDAFRAISTWLTEKYGEQRSLRL